MDRTLFDAAELVKSYRGELGIVEGEPCQKCLANGVMNPVYYYTDTSKGGRGRCFSCYHVEGNKSPKMPAEFMELENGDRVFEGRKCPSCKHTLHIHDEETRERLGAKRLGGCYHCALMKHNAAKPIAEHRDFMDDVRKGVWHFMVKCVERSQVVEVVARNGLERSQIKQLLATAMMMNRHAELAGLTERYDVDHFYPASGDGDVRGMTNIANLRIIRSDVNRAKGASIPTSYTPEQVLNIAELMLIQTYRDASKALKRWFDEGEKASDYTPERQAVYAKKQQALKAEVEAVENRISEGFCRAVYAAIDEGETSLLDVLAVAQNKLRRYDNAGQNAIVEAYRRRLELHGNHSFVKIDKPDLASFGYIGKGAVIRAVEATVSNVLDGITILMERGITPDEQRIIDAITYDCVGWALNSMDGSGEVMPFVSPLLGVFGEKVFAVRERYGKHVLTVYQNNVQKMMDEAELTPFDGDPVGEVLLSADAGDVLDRLAEFNNETLAIQRRKQAAADARAAAIQSIKGQIVSLVRGAGEASEGIENAWVKLMQKAEAVLCDGCESEEDKAGVLEFFASRRRPEFDAEKGKQRDFMTACREVLATSFSEPADAKAELSKLVVSKPVVSLPDPFRPEPVHDIAKLRAIAERMEREDAEKVEKAKAEKADRERKALWLRSPAGQEWLRNEKRGQNRPPRNLVSVGRQRWLPR